MARQYKVINALGHPEGVPVISIRKNAGSEDMDDYFDGDVWAPRRHIAQSSVDALVEEGILEEVKSDGQTGA